MGSVDSDDGRLQLPTTPRRRFNRISSDDDDGSSSHKLDVSSDENVSIGDAVNDRPRHEVGTYNVFVCVCACEHNINLVLIIYRKNYFFMPDL